MGDQTLGILGTADLSKSDRELGEWLVASWLGFQAEKAGIPVGNIPLEWATSIIEVSSNMDSDSVENAVLESVFRKACNGDYETAGRMLRAHMHDGAFSIVVEQYAQDGLMVRAGRRKGGKRTGASKSVVAAAWHEECRKAAEQLLANGRSRRELAGILSRRFGVTATQVRAVLRKAKPN